MVPQALIESNISLQAKYIGILVNGYVTGAYTYNTDRIYRSKWNAP